MAIGAPPDSVRCEPGATLRRLTPKPRSWNLKPGANGRHEPPVAAATPTPSKRKANELQTGRPPFHDSPVAIGRQRFVEFSSSTGSVAGFPSSHTRHQFGLPDISRTATLWLSPTWTSWTSGTKTGSCPPRVISA